MNDMYIINELIIAHVQLSSREFVDLTSNVKHFTLLQTYLLNTKRFTFVSSIQRLAIVVVLILRRKKRFKISDQLLQKTVFRVLLIIVIQYY